MDRPTEIIPTPVNVLSLLNHRTTWYEEDARAVDKGID